MSAQDFAGALEDFEKGRGAEPAASRCVSLLRNGARGHGRHAGAAVAFRKELESNPNDYTSNLQLGILLKQDQDYAGARQCFERALRVGPGDAGCRATSWRPWICMDGHTAEARTALEKLTRRFRSLWRRSFAGYGLLPAEAQGGWRPERAIVLKLNAESQADEPGAEGKMRVRRRLALAARPPVPCSQLRPPLATWLVPACHIQESRLHFRGTPMAQALEKASDVRDS